MAERTSRSPTPGTYPRLLEDDALLASTGSTTPRTHNSIPTARGSKSVLHRPRKRRSLGAFDILKRSHSDLIDRDNLGKLHSSSFHRIKEVAQSLSEEEKAALKESAVDPAVAMSHLYASMLVQMERADEISSEVPIERLFILKRGKTLYYHGTVAAKPSVIFDAQRSVSVLAPPTFSNGHQPKRPKLSTVKDQAMRESFNSVLAQATNDKHPNPLKFTSFKTIESELANGGFKINFDGDWSWSNFETAYKSRSISATQSIIDAIEDKKITMTAIDHTSAEVAAEDDTNAEAIDACADTTVERVTGELTRDASI
ncbi:hypothetical protein V1519DRAFT_187165 [Lipomyces tetrasporus]